MPVSPFRSSASATAISTTPPSPLVVAKPAGTVNGDLLIISATTRAIALGATRPIDVLAGFTEGTPTNTPPANFSNIYNSFQFKIAAGEPASYSCTFNAAVTDVILVASAWDMSLLAGILANNAYADSGATQDVAAPFEAACGGAANAIANRWGLVFHSNSTFSSGADNLLVPAGWSLANHATVALNTATDMGAGGTMFHRIYDEFRSNAWPAEPGPPPDSWNWPSPPNPFVFVAVWGLWLPDLTAAIAAPPGFGFGSRPFEAA